MISFVTALFNGNKLGIPHSTNIYNGEWVDKLYRGIKRNTQQEFELICLVDDEYDITEPVKKIYFESDLSSDIGWSLLSELYRPDLTPHKRIAIGLDTIILKNIDDILSFNGNIGLVTDPYYPDRVCNAISISNQETTEYIWKTWTEKKDWILKNCMLDYNGIKTPSEMVMLRVLFDNRSQCPRLDKIYPNKIFSYKVHVIKKPKYLNTASIVYFHGHPKPNNLHDVKFNQYILRNWV